MSASREKKQRQGGTPSNKALTAQQQADLARRKTIQYAVIGVVVAVLVIALLVWNSGFFQGRAAAVTVNGTKYSAGEVSYYYYGSSAFQNTYMLAQYGMSSYDTSLPASEQTYSVDSETGEVTTYHDYFLQSAMDTLESVTALYDAAIADGYTAADVKDTVDSSIASFKERASSNGYSYAQFLAANYGKYVTPSVYKSALTRSALASLYISDYEEKLSYTDQDYQNYYSEHDGDLDTFTYSYLYFTPEAVPTTDADGNAIEMTDEERQAAEAENLAAAKAKAEAAKAALEGGADAADVIEEYAPSNSAADSSVVGSSLNSLYADWLRDAGRKAGDVELIENSTSGYYVVAFQDRYLDGTLSVNVRHILVQADMDEDASAPTDEQMAAAKAEAESILARWQNGEATEASFGALADELSEDGRDSSGNLITAGGLYEEVVPGSFVTNFNDWLFNQGQRTPGDTEIIEVNGSRYYGYHVAYFVGENAGDFAWEHTVHDTLADTDTNTWMEGLTEGYTASQAGGIKYVG